MMQRTLSDYSFLRMDFLCRRLRYCTSTATAELCNNKRLTGTSFLLYLIYRSVISARIYLLYWQEHKIKF